MELRHLKTFQVVADCLNLTKAAEQLGYSQPGITLQIQTLEKELGRTLLTRTGRHTFLTPAGEVLKHHTARLFAVVGELEDDLRKLDHPHGTLVIAAPEYYCTRYLPTIIARYVQQHPAVKVRLVTANSVEAAKLVRDNQADIAIVAGDMQTPEVAATLIASEPLLMVIADALAGDRETGDVLQTFPFLTDRVIEVHVCGNIMAELDFSPASVLEFTSEAAIKQAVLNRLGMGVLGIGIIEQELASGELRVLHQFAKNLDTSIIARKNRAQEAGIHSFSQLVRECWEEAKK